MGNIILYECGVVLPCCCATPWEPVYILHCLLLEGTGVCRIILIKMMYALYTYCLFMHANDHSIETIVLYIIINIVLSVIIICLNNKVTLTSEMVPVCYSAITYANLLCVLYICMRIVSAFCTYLRE